MSLIHIVIYIDNTYHIHMAYKRHMEVMCYSYSTYTTGSNFVPKQNSASAVQDFSIYRVCYCAHYALSRSLWRFLDFEILLKNMKIFTYYSIVPCRGEEYVVQKIKI